MKNINVTIACLARAKYLMVCITEAHIYVCYPCVSLVTFQGNT